MKHKYSSPTIKYTYRSILFDQQNRALLFFFAKLVN